MATPSIVDARNLLDPAAVRRLGFAYTGDRTAVSRVVGGRRRRASSGSHLCDAPGGPGRRGRLRRRPVDRARRDNVAAPAAATSGSPSCCADVSEPVEVGRARSTPCATSPARPRRRPTWPARSRPWPWAARAPAACSSWPRTTRHGSSWPDQRDLRRPRGPPPGRVLPGQRRSDRARAASTTRPSGSPRASPWPCTAPTGSTSASPASSTPTAPGSPRATGGWCPTSSPRPCAASPSPSTGTAPRPGACATSTTRWPGCSPCSTRRRPARSTSATPTSAPCSSWPPSCSR